MARTITAKFKVYNDGAANVAASFQVKLIREVRDEHDALIKGATAVATQAIPTIAAGARSVEYTLTSLQDLAVGHVMTAWLSLDRVSPSPATGIATSAAKYYVEVPPTIYGGTLESVTITIAAPVGRLMDALVEAGTR